jgi:hypothetical protein
MLACNIIGQARKNYGIDDVVASYLCYSNLSRNHQNQLIMKYLIYLISINLLVAFPVYSQHSHHSSEETANNKTPIETASCPYLTKNGRGEIVLSWVRTLKDESVLYYATSKNKGLSFQDTVEVFPSKGLAPHGENLPKVVSKADGEIIAVWGTKNPNPKNKYSGLIFYSQSFDNGRSWTNATPIVNSSESFDQRYFDVASLPNGEAALVWLDNPNNQEKEGSFLYFATTNGKGGFQNKKPIGETTCQCCRTDLHVDPKGNIHVVYRDILTDSIRDMVHSVSFDGGKTFSKPNRISKDNWVLNGCPHTGPTMSASDKGLHFAWFTKGGEPGVYYTTSSDNGGTFKARQLLKTTARHPQMTALENGIIGIVWDEEENDNVEDSQIKLLAIKPGGKKESLRVSEGKGKCSFPVILEIEENALITAWLQDSEIKHKRIVLN